MGAERGALFLPWAQRMESLLARSEEEEPRSTRGGGGGGGWRFSRGRAEQASGRGERVSSLATHSEQLLRARERRRPSGRSYRRPPPLSPSAGEINGAFLGPACPSLTAIVAPPQNEPQASLFRLNLWVRAQPLRFLSDLMCYVESKKQAE